jgi:hypothetical protein
MAAVRGYGETGMDGEVILPRFSSHAGNKTVLNEQIRCSGIHEQVEGGIAFGLLCEKVQKVPLRHEGDKFAVGRQAREIGDTQM